MKRKLSHEDKPARAADADHLVERPLDVLETRKHLEHGVCDDDIEEGSEQAILTLVASSNYVLGVTISGTVTIADDDIADVLFVETGGTTNVTETGTTDTYTIELASEPTEPVSMNRMKLIGMIMHMKNRLHLMIPGVSSGYVMYWSRCY